MNKRKPKPTSKANPKTLSVKERFELADEAIQRGVHLGMHTCFEEALAQFDEALRFCDGAQDANLKQLIARAFANKGASLGDMERFDEAVACYGRAIAAYTELAERGDRIDLVAERATAVMNKGWALLNLGKDKEGLACLEQALELRRALLHAGVESAAPDVARSLYTLAEGLLRAKRLPEALSKYEEAISIWKSLIAEGNTEFEEDVVFAISSLADLYLQLGNLAKAREYAGEAIRGFKQLIDLTRNPRIVAALDTTVALKERIQRELESGAGSGSKRQEPKVILPDIKMRPNEILAGSIRPELAQPPSPVRPVTPDMLRSTLRLCPPEVQAIYKKIITGWMGAGGKVEARKVGRIYLRLKTKAHRTGRFAQRPRNFSLLVLAAPKGQVPAHIKAEWDLSRSECAAYLDSIPEAVENYEQTVIALPGFVRRGTLSRISLHTGFSLADADTLSSSVLALKAAEESAP